MMHVHLTWNVQNNDNYDNRAAMPMMLGWEMGYCGNRTKSAYLILRGLEYEWRAVEGEAAGRPRKRRRWRNKTAKEAFVGL